MSLLTKTKPTSVQMDSLGGKLKRKEWRKLWKKRRRKLRRQKLAQERDRLEAAQEAAKQADPQHQQYLAEKERLDREAEGREELERALRNAVWLENEQKAQLKFAETRRRLEDEQRAEQAKRERIRKEFEEMERKVREAKAERIRQQQELRQMLVERQHRLEQFAATGITHDLEELRTVYNTRSDTTDCRFFSKTGACRFGLRCVENHPTPGLSKILLIVNFFNHPALERTAHTEYGLDVRLEFDEEDLKGSFAEFFRDIVEEFEKFGSIRHIFVCRNSGVHLRGNVYIEFEHMRNAAAAYLRMNGRFYAKKQLRVEFRNPIVWPAAVCGLSEMRRCQKGPGCNFLHIFKNPDDRYRYDHFRESRSVRREAAVTVPATPLNKKSWDEITASSSQRARNSAHWRWSESPEMDERRLAATDGVKDTNRDVPIEAKVASPKRRPSKECREKSTTSKRDKKRRSHERSRSPKKREAKKEKRNGRRSRERTRSRSQSSSRSSRKSKRKKSRSRSRSRRSRCR